jgi:hypothetical protein
MTTGKRAADSGRGGPPSVNASVAQSMASKLSDTELAAIISMTDKLSQMEKEVYLLRNEKEALSAKLDGTEAVKQFLIGKVRDVDLKLNRSMEEEIKVTQQISSDQEVIAFLDSRVQELERVSDDVSKERNSAQLQSIKVSTSKKISMLSDMLKYEREKLKDEESEWKATIKYLSRRSKVAVHKFWHCRLSAMVTRNRTTCSNEPSYPLARILQVLVGNIIVICFRSGLIMYCTSSPSK